MDIFIHRRDARKRQIVDIVDKWVISIIIRNIVYLGFTLVFNIQSDS